MNADVLSETLLRILLNFNRQKALKECHIEDSQEADQQCEEWMSVFQKEVPAYLLINIISQEISSLAPSAQQQIHLIKLPWHQEVADRHSPEDHAGEKVHGFFVVKVWGHYPAEEGA